MAWDSSRPVPWQRLMREWLLYVAIMAVIFVLFFRDRGLVGILGGLLASGPLYLAFGYVLAKLGYRRQTLSELRSQPAASKRSTDDGPAGGTDEGSAPRSRPAPTRRTGGAPAPKRKPKRKR